MNNRQISILIVLYAKQLSESVTVKSIIANQSNYHNKINLTIVNNGPANLHNTSEFISLNIDKFNTINIVEYLDNKPLSLIYDEFLTQSPKSYYYVIFDDDSQLSQFYLSELSSLSADVIIPRILSKDDGNYYYPEISGRVVENVGPLNSKTLMSITSGLCLGEKTISVFTQKYKSVFDQNFALYGIDTSFFMRLRKCIANGENFNVVCLGTILHSLSRASGQTISDFRLRERLYDAAITARHYPSQKSIVYVLKKIVQNTILFKFDKVSLIIKTYFAGKHPRCK